MHWTPTPAKTKDVPFISVLRPIQNPVPGMWLSLSHVNRSFSSWISQYVSFLLSPYDRFLSWKLYPSGMKINISASILLYDTTNTQTKRMKSLKEIHCSQTTTTGKQNIAWDVRAGLIKGAKSSKEKALSSLLLECPGSSSVLSSGKYQFRSIWPSAEFLTVIGSKERSIEKLRKWDLKIGNWQTLLWFLTLETLCCETSIRGSLINHSSDVWFPNNRTELQPKVRYGWRLSPE